MDSSVKNREIFKFIKPEEFSPQEMRFLECFVANVNFHTRAVTFTKKEFDEMMEISASAQLGDVIKGLQNKYMYIRELKSDVYYFYNIFDRCKYFSEEERGYIELRASVEAFPLMTKNDINKGEELKI